MRTSSLLPLVIMLCISPMLFSQSFTQTIKGTVVDKQSQFTLPGVNIILPGSKPVKGTTTDANGIFRLEEVPVGRQEIQLSYLGYETVTLSNLMLTSAKELELIIELEESINQLEEVEVIASEDKRESINKMAVVSSRSFSIEEAGRYSGSLQDPARMAQNFAGVSGASDDRNDIIIRGNAPTGVLWRMEGIDIPSPNHFASLGTTGGPVSMLNINNLKNSDFMTGAFSADYGNALSGVFDLQLRTGNKDKWEYLGQVGFNGFELGAEGPFKKGKKASYLINYRYSTLEVLKAFGVDFGTGESVPQYQDVTFKVDIPTSKAGRFTLFGIGGLSYIELLADKSNDQDLYSDDAEDVRFESNTGIIGASHTYFYDEKTFSKIVIAASGTQTKGDGDSLSTDDGTPIQSFGFDRVQRKYSANLKLNRKFNAKNNGSVGVILDYYNFDMADSSREGNRFERDADFKGGGALLQSYIQWQHRFNNQWTLNTGLHSQHFLYNQSNSIEPRIGLRYKLNPRHSFSFGSGLHSQLQPVTLYFVKEQRATNTKQLPNKNLDFTRSVHLVAAHEFFINSDMRLKTELYYQRLFDVPVDTFPSNFSMLNEGADFELPNSTGLVNEGTGYNYGLEITLEKFFSKGYYFLFTSSLFNSRYEGSDGVERNTIFNGNYVFNALAGKEIPLGKNKTLSFDTKLTYAGGRRYTPVDFQASRLLREEILLEDQAFSKAYDPYFRADFKITFRINGKRVAQQFAIDLQNFTGQKNIFEQEYNSSNGQIETTYQRGFFPDVQYKIFF